jgi:quercetin dioxygenase-like cupin family protein
VVIMEQQIELKDYSTGERLRLIRTGAETGGEFVEGVSTFPPTLANATYHEHPRQEERLKVVDGTVIVRIDGKLKFAGPGATVVIPPGVAHEVSNAGREPAQVVWRFHPALRTDDYLRATLETNGQPGIGRFQRMLKRIAVAAEFTDEYRKATLPWIVQWPVFKVIGRTAGREKRDRSPADDGEIFGKRSRLFGAKVGCAG